MLRAVKEAPNRRKESEPTETEKTEFFKCAISPYYFLTHYCYTLHVDAPEGEDKTQLIPESAHVHKMIDFYNAPTTDMMMKSRQLLATWIIAALKLHSLLFAEPYSYVWFTASEKEKKVDDGTIESAHGKILFIWERLPDFLRQQLIFQNCYIENPATGNFINGTSTTETSGRSGAYTGGDIDEGQSIENWDSFFASVSFAIKRRLKIIFNAPELTTAAILELYEKEDSGIGKHKMYWWEYHSEEWYWEQCRRLKRDQIARELDLRPGGSSEALVWPSFRQDTHVKDGLFRSNLPVELSIDPGYSDTTSIVFYQINQSEIYIIDDYEARLRTPEEHIRFIYEKLAEYRAVDPEGLKYWDVLGESEKADAERAILKSIVITSLVKIRAVGDPAIWSREQTSGTSPGKQYQDWGLTVETREKSDVEYGITQIDARFKNLKLFLDRKCKVTAKNLEGYSYPTDKDGRRKQGEKPKHDDYSHGGAALRYMGENNPMKWTPPAVRRKQYKPPADTGGGMFKTRFSRARAGMKKQGGRV